MSRLPAFALAFLCLAVPMISGLSLLPPEEPGAEVCFVPGECQGPLVGTAFEASAAACRATCRSFGPEPPPPPGPADADALRLPGMCEWFTFHPSDGLCVLYERCEIDIDSCPSCVSGKKECPLDTWPCNLSGACSGDLLHAEVDSTHRECQLVCQDYPGCIYYTYNYDNGICELFKECRQDPGPGGPGEEECPNCVSGRPFCGVESFVMTIGGNVLENNANVVELTSLNSLTSSVPPCLQNLSPFPMNVQFAAAGLLNGMPTICGGSDGPSSKSSCWGYSLATDSWSEVGQMPEPKSGMGRDFEQQWGIVMAGGEAVQNFTDYQDSVYETLDGATFSALEPLPLPVSGGCAAILDSDRMFFAGGRQTTEGGNGTFMEVAFIYSKVANQWRNISGMPTPREELSCGVVRDASGVPVEVVTMGGIGFGSGFDVEIFDLGTETWRTAAGMPFPIYYGASTVRYGNSFLLVGGEGPSGAAGAIQQWDEASATLQPVAAGAALGTPRGGAAAVLIEAAAFPSCFP